MPKIWIQETCLNKTDEYCCGESDVYETWADVSQKAQLIAWLKKEYGRIVSKVYIDQKDAPPKTIGYVFEKRVKYDDCTKTYLQHVWVTFHTAPPTKTTTYHYA